MDMDAERAKERGFDRLQPIDAAFERGEITAEEWHSRVLEVIEPAYLDATTEQGGSGHGGTPAEWEVSRGLVMSAIGASGTLLDVGCANGLLMESIARWSRERGLEVEPYGVEISPRIAEVARARYPHWRDRIWTANAATWAPPRFFGFVRTGLEYVPTPCREAYVRHLVEDVVEPGGRLIVGKTNEDRDRPGIADELRSWGFDDVREVRRPHEHPDVEQTVVWLDRA